MKFVIIAVILSALVPTTAYLKDLASPTSDPRERGSFAQRYAKLNREDKIDALISREIIKLIEAQKITEFIAMVQYLQAVGVNKELYTDAYFTSVASSNPLYLLLLIKGKLIDLNALDCSGRTAGVMIFLLPEGRERVVRLEQLVQLGYKLRAPEMLVAAAQSNSTTIINVVEELIGEDKLEVNVLGSGRSPLIEAVRFGALDSVKALLIRGADPRSKDSAGNTALDFVNEELPLLSIPNLSHEEMKARQLEIRREVLKYANRKREEPRVDK